MRASDVYEPASPIMFFYSVPASPEYCFSPSYSQPETPWDFEDADSSFDDFEFDTSRRFNLNDLDIDLEERIDKEKRQEKQESLLPEMAFADELFCNGKVLPLHPPSLKLPPRLQNCNADDGGKNITTSTSLRSPISALRSKISRASSLDSSFDPFMVALEKVRDDDDYWGETLEIKPDPTAGPKAHPHSPNSGSRPNSLEISGLTHPKGLAIARKVRLAHMGFKSKMSPAAEPVEDKNDNMNETKGGKWNFLSLGIRKPSFLRRHKGKPGGIGDGKKVTEMTVVPYRPKFSMCLGLRPNSNEDWAH